LYKAYIMQQTNKKYIKVMSGCASNVKITNTHAYKYMPINELYHIRELNCLYNIKNNNHSSFNHFECVHFDKEYCRIKFPRLDADLLEIIFNNDRDVLQCLLDVSSGIAYLHNKRIIHRDLKSDNIMIKYPKQKKKLTRYKIIDFSHSIEIKQPNVYLDEYVSTFGYRSPEVFKYKQSIVKFYESKIDLWALGIILFEMVCNTSLYQEKSESEIFEYLRDHQSFENKFKPLLESNYNKFKSKNLIHTKIYFQWIKLLLSEEANQRPNACDFHAIVSKFAKAHLYKLEKATKTNHYQDIFCQARPDFVSLYIRINHQLFDRAIDTIKKFNMIDKYCYVDIDVLRPILLLLISYGNLTHVNLFEMAIALRAIVNVLLYDQGINQIKSSIKLISNRREYNTINDINVNKAVAIILAELGYDLMLHDTFNFRCSC